MLICIFLLPFAKNKPMMTNLFSQPNFKIVLIQERFFWSPFCDFNMTLI